MLEAVPYFTVHNRFGPGILQLTFCPFSRSLSYFFCVSGTASKQLNSPRIDSLSQVEITGQGVSGTDVADVSFCFWQGIHIY